MSLPQTAQSLKNPPFLTLSGVCKPPADHPTLGRRLSWAPCETTNPGMPCAVSRRGAPQCCLHRPCALNAGSCSVEEGDGYLNT